MKSTSKLDLGDDVDSESPLKEDMNPEIVINSRR